MPSFHRDVCHTGRVCLVRFSIKICSDPAAKTTSEASEAGCPCLSADTERALQVMEACQAEAAEGVKGHAEKLLNIFQSDLFQALLGNVFLCYTDVLPRQRNTTIRRLCSVHGAIFVLRSEQVRSWTRTWLSVSRLYHTNQALLVRTGLRR